MLEFRWKLLTGDKKATIMDSMRAEVGILREEIEGIEVQIEGGISDVVTYIPKTEGYSTELDTNELYEMVV